MKTRKILSFFLLLGLLAGGEAAWAHGARVGVYVGAPIMLGPMWYPSPYYYQPVPVVVAPPAPPPVYIEQAPAVAPVEVQQSYWYYCKPSKSYYPYVKECPAGWERVLPQPEK